MNIKVEIKKTTDSEVEITGEIPYDQLEIHRKAVMEKLGKGLKVDGFRPGKVPENIVIEKLGAMSILQEMAEVALSKAYPKIINENKIEAIDRPDIHITKLAEGNPLGFKIIQAVLPEIKLPDYIKIAAESNKKFDNEAVPVVITDEELDETIKNIRGSRKKNPKDDKEVAPALDDEFVKTLGDFLNVTDFKTKLRDNMKEEKEHKQKDKRRLSIVDAILDKCDIPTPEVLVERQSAQNVEHFRSSIERMGIKFEDYLKQANKTIEDVKKEALPDAKKKVQINLMLEEIAKAEKITVANADIDAEAKKIFDHYAAQPNSDANHPSTSLKASKPDEHSVRHYVEGILKNDIIFKLLEGQK